MDSPTYKELEFDNEDFMLDPFNDGEAMTDMSKPINDQSTAMNGHNSSIIDGQQPDSLANMHIDNLQ